MYRPIKFLGIAVLSSTLIACGSSDDDDSPTTANATVEGQAANGAESDAEAPEASARGSLSVALTDAPVDTLSRVQITISSLELKPVSGPSFSIDLDSNASVNLLDYQGDASFELVADADVPAGDYEWIRLQLVEGETNTYVVEADSSAQFALDLPGNSEELKLQSNFTVPESGSAFYTIDFDARKSVVLTGAGDYKLKPVLRLADNALTSTLQVDIANSFVTCGDGSDNRWGDVYIYSGNVDPYGDLGSENEPLVVVPVRLGENNTYTVTAGFLPDGVYELAYTCDAANDDVEVGGDDIVFAGSKLVELGDADADVPVEDEFDEVADDINDGLDEAEDGIEEGLDETDDALDEAGDEIQDGLNEVGDELDEVI